MAQIKQYQIDTSEYAEVTAVHHPLVNAKGFTNISPGEMVVFDDDDQSLGQVLSFNTTEIKLMIFSKKPIKTGSKLYRTKKQLSFPITSSLLGSVFGPLGELLITNNKKISSTVLEYREVYQEPAKITQRKRIANQLITGFSVTDLLLPIGEGQRELLIGDRKAGKGVFARNIAVKQAQLGNTVVYAMIAKTTADIKSAYDYFIKQNVIDNIVIIASTPKDSVSSIVVTPYSAMTVAEYLLTQGNNVLLILDDLTSQAEFYREISLLAKKFPGRDSYPGDIFFAQAELLERSGTFAHPQDSKKTVSLTCLPVVRTMSSDLTDFIASNLISITDGHLLFEPRLFNQGFRPAINTGLSVTRVGKQTQTAVQRDINLKVTSFLAMYQKTKNLTHLGSEISEKSQKILLKGEILTNFFSETNGLPLNVQIILLTMIWLDWFEQSHKNVISNCKFELDKQYTKKNVQEKIDLLLTNSKSFAELLETVEKEKTFLLNLCQV